MTLIQKNELINRITSMLDKLIDVDAESPAAPVEPSVDKPLEMLTIKECAALVDGLSEHTVRMLCTQDKIAHVRAGAGRNGKILVSKISDMKEKLTKKRNKLIRYVDIRDTYERISKRDYVEELVAEEKRRREQEEQKRLQKAKKKKGSR